MIIKSVFKKEEKNWNDFKIKRKEIKCIYVFYLDLVL